MTNIFRTHCLYFHNFICNIYISNVFLFSGNIKLTFSRKIHYSDKNITWHYSRGLKNRFLSIVYENVFEEVTQLLFLRLVHSLYDIQSSFVYYFPRSFIILLYFCLYFFVPPSFFSSYRFYIIAVW